jgi:hypothetical protein
MAVTGIMHKFLRIAYVRQSPFRGPYIFKKFSGFQLNI